MTVPPSFAGWEPRCRSAPLAARDVRSWLKTIRDNSLEGATKAVHDPASFAQCKGAADHGWQHADV